MIALGLDAVASVVEGELERAPDADEITGVQVDSRRVAPGDLFVAVGRGVQFLDDARVRGAAATLVPREPFAAFAALGAAVRNRSSAKVVGITGSTGKTSTKDILAALCAPVARTVAAEASFNNEIGVPLTLCRLEPDTRGLHRGAGDARLRPDRRALRDHAARRGRRHQRRPGPSRAGRVDRGRGACEERAGCRPARGRHGDRADGLPGRTGGHRGHSSRGSGGRSRRRAHHRRRCELQLHGPAPDGERGRGPRRARRAGTPATDNGPTSTSRAGATRSSRSPAGGC